MSYIIVVAFGKGGGQFGFFFQTNDSIKNNYLLSRKSLIHLIQLNLVLAKGPRVAHGKFVFKKNVEFF